MVIQRGEVDYKNITIKDLNGKSSGDRMAAGLWTTAVALRSVSPMYRP